MKTFKSITDLEQLLAHGAYAPLHATIKSLFLSIINDYPEYRPQDDGYLVLVEHSDVDRVLDDLDMLHKLSEVPFEGVTMVDGCFLAVWLPNNQFGLDFLVPDAEWLPGEVRRHLEAHLEL